VRFPPSLPPYVIVTHHRLLSIPLPPGHGRRLLDAALLRALDGGGALEVAESPVVGAMLTLLTTDGMATNMGVRS